MLSVTDHNRYRGAAGGCYKPFGFQLWGRNLANFTCVCSLLLCITSTCGVVEQHVVSIKGDDTREGCGRRCPGTVQDHGEGDSSICEEAPKSFHESYIEGYIPMELTDRFATQQVEVPEHLHVDQEKMWNSFPLTSIAWDDTCQIHGWTERSVPRKVWDAFTFFNEVEMLRLRLDTLWNVVDHFVVIEADKTFTGLPKPFVLQEVADQFYNYSGKLRYHMVDNLPNSDDPWVVEAAQRDEIRRTVWHAAPDDLVLIADVDEIPFPHTLSLLARCNGWDTSGAVNFLTRFHHFRFGLTFEKYWYHPQAVERHMLDMWSPSSLRKFRSRPSHLRLEDAGWHLSYFMDAQGVIEKLRSFSHQEFVKQGADDDPGKIEAAIREGTDLFYGELLPEEIRGMFGRLIRHETCVDVPPPVSRDPGRYAAWLPPDADCDPRSLQ